MESIQEVGLQEPVSGSCVGSDLPNSTTYHTCELGSLYNTVALQCIVRSGGSSITCSAYASATSTRYITLDRIALQLHTACL